MLGNGACSFGSKLQAAAACFEQPIRSSMVECKGGLQLHIRKAGNTDPTCIFVHGWGGDSRLWLPLMLEISPHISSCAIDLPGHGLSNSKGGPLEWASAVAEIAASASGPVVLVGHSMGSRIAALAAASPTVNIAGIVSLDGDLGAYDYTPKQRWRFLRHFSSQKGNEVALSYLSQLCAHGEDLNHWEIIREMAQGVSLEIKGASLDWIVSSRAEATPQCPVYGAFSDRTTSSHRIAELRRMAPQARVDIIEHSDHFLPLSATKVCATKIRTFLQREVLTCQGPSRIVSLFSNRY
jgi:pimeloyl-ACP methyl ester carboxylesterase